MNERTEGRKNPTGLSSHCILCSVSDVQSLAEKTERCRAGKTTGYSDCLQGHFLNNNLFVCLLIYSYVSRPMTVLLLLDSFLKDLFLRGSQVVRASLELYVLEDRFELPQTSCSTS